MPTVEQLTDLTKKARTTEAKRDFSQSFELIMALSDIDTKKQEININEAVFLPHRIAHGPVVCVFASGDLALRARNAGADMVMEPEALDRLASEKREAKKMARRFDFFLAETALMARIGKILGPQLGPKGKMPTPIPPNAPIEGMVTRFQTATRLRCRNQMSIACKVGDEAMKDEQVAENALAVFNTVERKLPSGERNIRNTIIKLSMGPPAKLSMLKE